MMTAAGLLESSLDELASKLDELADDHSPELDSIRDTLTQIAKRGLETNDFISNLKDLAEAVIQVRTKPGISASLRGLPVPPYDLWLPFKAEDLADSDPQDLEDAVRIFKEFNEKVDASAFRSVNAKADNEEAKLEKN